MGPFYGWGSTASMLQSHYRETVSFLPLTSQKFLVLILKVDESLSWLCNHPMVLSTRPLDWESTILTTRPLLQDYWQQCSSRSSCREVNLKYLLLFFLIHRKTWRYWRPATLLKRDSSKGVFLCILWNFKKTFLQNTSGRLLLPFTDLVPHPEKIWRKYFQLVDYVS